MAENLPPEAGAPAQAPGAESGGDAGGKFAQALAEAHKAVSLVAELAGSDPAISQKLAAAKAAIEAVVDDGGGEAPAQPSGPAPMEAGAAKVRPVL